MGKFSASKSIFSRAFSGFFGWFQPRKWTNYDNAKQDAFFLLKLLRGTMSRDPETGRRRKRHQHQSFDSFVAKSKMTEESLAHTIKVSGWYAVLYFIAAICVFVYGFIIMEKGMIVSTVVTFLLSLMLFSQGIHQHVICLRLKHRTLSINLMNWFGVACGKEPPKDK